MLCPVKYGQSTLGLNFFNYGRYVSLGSNTGAALMTIGMGRVLLPVYICLCGVRIIRPRNASLRTILL